MNEVELIDGAMDHVSRLQQLQAGDHAKPKRKLQIEP